MGKVIVNIKLTNQADLVLKDFKLLKHEPRSVEVDAPVDTGATRLHLKPSVIMCFKMTRGTSPATLPLIHLIALALTLLTSPPAATAATTQTRYYAHEAVHDPYGVIAPWYRGINGPCDFRVRIAAETLKRYPWTTTQDAIAAYPHYLFTSLWQISSNGIITPKNPGDWMNGDLGQRATSVLNGFVDYYRYTGDAAAIAHLTFMANYLLDFCLTPLDHPWPGLFISVPVKGRPYGKCDPAGMIQLDICGSTGHGLLRAYQVTGNVRWFATAKHWGDLLAEHCNLNPNADPWPRYANPESAPWKDNKQTGGVTMILAFLDELIRLGYTGKDHSIVAARDAGRRYLRDKLLPAWTKNDTWGRYFWDWDNPVQNCGTTPDAARYLLNNAAQFPNAFDARNLLTLFLNRSSVAPESRGDIYSGAWAYPEASQCCGRSLWYAPLGIAPVLAQYGVQTRNAWSRELAYRQVVLQTYDAHETGVTEDNIDGGVIVNGDWFNIAHPLPLRHVLGAMAWLPEELGASRENHIMASSAVVNSVQYAKGRIEYSTFDATANTVDVLRLAFVPKEITANGRALPFEPDLTRNGCTIKRLPNGDSIVRVRHDHATRIVIMGNDPQHDLDDDLLVYQGDWQKDSDTSAFMGTRHCSATSNSTMTGKFTGNQVRLIGRVDSFGGLADVYLDEVKQWAPIDGWNPGVRSQQVLYYKNGLNPGPHTLKVVLRGTKNPYSQGCRIHIDALQYSGEAEKWNFPVGTGPRESQRMIFGYTGRQDYVDSEGHPWRPGTELVTRLAAGEDSLKTCWWTTPSAHTISGTPDSELYRYGVHGQDFWVNLTVGPGEYHARLKFVASSGRDTNESNFSIQINHRLVAERFNVAATAGGLYRAVDLVFNGITPLHGIIEIRFTGAPGIAGEKPVRGQAFVHAMEVGLGDGGKGSARVCTPIQK